MYKAKVVRTLATSASIIALFMTVMAIQVSAVTGQEEIKKFTLVAKRADVVIGDNVVFKAMTWDGTLPGPLMVVDEGDEVEITVKNEDDITHGLSMHAANTQTSSFVGNIAAGDTKTLSFKAESPGVFMYHCAPGGHGIMTHTMGGMFGMFIVEPKTKYKLEESLGRLPDLKIYIAQHEIYANGRDFFDGKQLYVMFNGYTFRYVKEPIQVRPGDYLRIYYQNIGPNLTSTFHVVGGIWDYMYSQGNPKNVTVGGQSVLSGPTDSWVIEWQVPDAEGSYTFVSHAFGTQAIKGTIGIFSAKYDAPRIEDVSSVGPTSTVPDQPKRVVSPFGISPDLDVPSRFQQGEVIKIQIVGNSYWPKIAEVPQGAEVTWVNEDVFDLLDGELTGRHDVAVNEGPKTFVSPKLGHAESYTIELTELGEYRYTCTIHPYMQGVVRVVPAGLTSTESTWLLPLASVLALVGVALLGYTLWRKVIRSGGA